MAERFRIVFDEGELDSLLKQPDGAVAQQILQPLAENFTNEARRRVRVLSGKTRDQMTGTVDRDAEGLKADIGSVWYLRFHEQGTRKMRAYPVLLDMLKNLQRFIQR